MSYTAKHWTNPVNISADNMNELELGVQEAHEGIDRLEKIIPGLQSENNDILKELEKVTSGTSDAFNLLKDIQNTLKSEPNLAEILKQNSENFLLKTSQPLTNIEKQQVLKNLGLNKYTFLEDIIVNGNQITNGILDLKIPGIDTELNRNSQNAVANYAIVKALENFGTPDLSRYMNIHNESTTAHSDLRELINSKASKSYVEDALKNIPVPDVSGQISDHNLDSSAHQDIRNLIKNIDLSGYSLINHNHDEVYAPIHNHPYAAEDHTHNYATPEYVDNKINNIEMPNISTEIHYHNTSDTAHQDIREAIKNIDLSGYSKTDHTHNDYLPLTAGVNKKVTGALHVDNNITISNGKAYRAYDNSGTISELLRLSTGNVIILGDGNSSLDIATHGTVRPSSGKSLNLGTSTYPWTNIYGTTIYQNGKQVADKDHTHDYSNTYASSSHNHDGVYAPATHNHDYATQSNIDTAISDFKTWLLGTGNADTIDTIKDIVDIMEDHKDVLDTLGNTYALKGHNHDSTYAAKSHTHTEYAKLSGGNTFTGVQHIKGTAGSKPFWVRGIQGCLEDGVTENELHLNYQSNHPVKWGYDANGQLNSDGTITEAGTLLSNKYAAKSHTHTDYATSSHNHNSVYLSKTSGGTVNGPVSFTGTIGNTQSTPGIYLGLDQNTGAENANMAIVSANTAAYIDMGRPNVDYDFRIIKWNNSGNTYAQLVYGGHASGTITIPQKHGTMALVEDIPNIYKGTSSTQSSNTTSVKTLRLGLVGSTLYIWTS